MIDNDATFDIKAVVPWIITVFAGIVAWFCRRGISQYDLDLRDVVKRTEILERNTVTYDHLERVLDRMRNDRNAMHIENQNQLNRIEGKIDENEERSSKTRHETQNELHALALKFAESSRKAG